MALLKEWQKIAYDEKKDKGALQRFWANYFNLEKGVYEKLLSDPDTEVKGTVKELAEKYGLSVMEMTGFLDGINESLVEANPIEEMEEDTVVSLKFDKEKLYKNMVDAKADWLHICTGQRDNRILFKSAASAIKGHLQHRCFLFISDQIVCFPISRRIHHSGTSHAGFLVPETSQILHGGQHTRNHNFHCLHSAFLLYSSVTSI